MNSLQPDIDLTPIQIGGTEAMPNVRVYWQPRCCHCNWQDEPHPTKTQAQSAAAMHLKMSCLSGTGGEPNGNAV